MTLRLSNSGASLILALSLIGATPVALAEETALLTPSAIGRISYGGPAPKADAPICTGTLVAADLVLTADHCVRGAVNSADSVYFSAGLQDGIPVAIGRGQEIILADPKVAKPGLAMDVALLRLSAPLEGVMALPPARGASTAKAYTLIAYARSAPDVQTRNDDCFALGKDADVIGLSCAVVSGNSGAPVLMRDGAEMRVVAVVVAATKGLPAALAVRIPSVLATQIDPLK